MAPRVPDVSLRLNPLTATVPAGTVLWHVWRSASERTATDFNPGHGSGRFHPIHSANGAVIPTFYGSLSPQGAIAESVFHGVPLDAEVPRVFPHDYGGRVMSALMVEHDQLLVDLTTPGLQRLRLSRDQLIEPAGAHHYRRTARWAEALYAARPEAAGLLWMARRWDRDAALVLFGDRVGTGDLRDLHESEPLDSGFGLDSVLAIAETADIVVVLPSPR